MTGHLRDSYSRMPLGKIIESAILAHGWTFTRAARELGVAEKTITRWRDGTSVPSARHRPVIEQKLGVSLAELGQPPATDDEAESTRARLAALEAQCDAQAETIAENRKAIRLLQARVRRLEIALRQAHGAPAQEETG